jgi:hypothetical protein
MPYQHISSKAVDKQSVNVATVSSDGKPSQSAVCSEVAVIRSPACKDVSPDAEEHPPLEAVTQQRD